VRETSKRGPTSGGLRDGEKIIPGPLEVRAICSIIRSSDELDVVGHVRRFEHLPDEHQGPNDVSDRSGIPLGEHDTRVMSFGRSDPKEVRIFGVNSPAFPANERQVFFIRGIE
jgi:hypothetical protein